MSQLLFAQCPVGLCQVTSVAPPCLGGSLPLMCIISSWHYLLPRVPHRCRVRPMHPHPPAPRPAQTNPTHPQLPSLPISLPSLLITSPHHIQNHCERDSRGNLRSRLSAHSAQYTLVCWRMYNVHWKIIKGYIIA